MGKFDHLKDLDVNETQTAEYELWEIQEEGKPVPVLILAPSGTANRPYFHDLLNRSQSVARAAKKKSISARQIDENREDDRELFPRHVVKGWRYIPEADGTYSQFTEDNVRDFLKALPDWLFDRVRTFTAQPENFLRDGAAAPEEVSEALLEG